MVLQAIRYQPGVGLVSPSLEILDQLVLPHESVYIAVNTCEEAHAAIKQMKVRGAPAIAIVAALALAVELGKALLETESVLSADQAQTNISQRLDYLKTSRPTAVNLSDAVRKLKKIVTEACAAEDSDGRQVYTKYIQAAERMLVDDVSDNQAIGRHGADWIQANTAAGRRSSAQGQHELKVLTHCNTGSLATAGYGTALGVIRSLHLRKLLTHAYCSETRPYNQGSRLTAYELVHDEIPATLITDSMAAALLAKEGESLAAIVVGADRVAANGDTANKIGTYSLAVLAKYHGIKFLVAAPRTTIDLETASGAEIVIEERNSSELTSVRGPKIDATGQLKASEPETVSIAASGVGVWNPAFDVTPAALIDGVITEAGVVEKVDGVYDFHDIFARISKEELEAKPPTFGET